ncbi:MAG: hypothetical protein FJ009_11450 [Chloroflexi bacterium]|nr:hypothetical protein [Chloroflexota bacterium]
MKFGTAVLLGMLLTVCAFAAPTVATADAPFCAFIPATGHNIHGAFFAFYRVRNGVENFGNPLTEAFKENGRIVQYFERARLEFFPENPEPFRVQVSFLGEQYGITDPPLKSQAIPPDNNPNFHYFPDSGQMVSFAIKEYFDQSGGIQILGYPISGLRFESGKFVQYFQRQRVVWDPMLSGANKVRPSAVGQLALDKKYPADFKARARVPTDWCGTPMTGPAPTPAPFVAPTPSSGNTALGMQVRVRFRQTRTTGPQYVDVIAEDQNGRRLRDVAAYAIVYLVNGERYFPLLPTNASGASTFGFEIGNQPTNCSVTVQVYGFSGALLAAGRDTFNCH